MTVLDSSGAIDLLLGSGAAEEVRGLLASGAPLAAPDLLVFEVMAVLRRQVIRGTLTAERARDSIEDLDDLALDLFPTLPLRMRAWALRDNMTAADGLFVALAERLGEALATADIALARAARTHTAVAVIGLGAVR